MGKPSAIKWDTNEPPPPIAYKEGDNSCMLCPEEKLGIQKYAENKLLSKTFFFVLMAYQPL